jgi:hypothetical protein
VREIVSKEVRSGLRFIMYDFAPAVTVSGVIYVVVVPIAASTAGAERKRENTRLTTAA